MNKPIITRHCTIIDKGQNVPAVHWNRAHAVRHVHPKAPWHQVGAYFVNVPVDATLPPLIGCHIQVDQHRWWRRWWYNVIRFLTRGRLP